MRRAVFQNKSQVFLNRIGYSFFPAAGKRNQKEPPLNEKLLKTSSIH
ncbi:hypothetical protein [Sunxiuqinia sp. A32]